MAIFFHKIIRQHFLVFIFLLLYFAAISFKLVSTPTPFYDWDESINAQVAKEMIENKSLVPLWQGSAWLDKPPLPFLFFGIIMKLTPFITPEISLRITSLILSMIALIFVYAVYLKTLGRTSAVEEERSDGKTAEVNRFMATLAVIVTAFIPIFLQRSQIVNLDVFLLIGWLGYLLFFRNFYLSLFFLSLSVLTKSLIGFYPACIMLGFYFLLLLKPPRLRSEAGEPRRLIKMVLIQIGILALWYLGMLLIFKGDFWQQHIIETHFKRVTASIESHFGAQTYYVDVLFQELGIFAWTSLLGLILVILNLFQDLIKRNKIDKYLYILFLLPWFIFLNLTKTKIFWYFYPAIPQFAFLSVYPLMLLVKRHSGKRVERARPESKQRFWSRFAPQNDVKKILLVFLPIILVSFIFNQNFIQTNFFTTLYSKPEDFYNLSLYARDRCESLTVLVEKNTRETTKILEELRLTIGSTKQWGNHPSMVYYFGKKVNFVFDKDNFYKNIDSIPKGHCLSLNKSDLEINDPRLRKPWFIGLFGDLSLLRIMY